MRREIELRASAGQREDFVAVVEIIPFPDGRMPDVVPWGTRTFIQPSPDKHPSTPRKSNEGRWVYVEAFVVWSLTASPGLPR